MSHDLQAPASRAALRPAFTFECPGCGAANFLPAKRDDAPPVEALDLHYDGEFLLAPAEATCTACGASVALGDD